MAEIQGLKPKFLTKEIAKLAIEHVLFQLQNSIYFKGLLSGRKNCSVVVLVPIMLEGSHTWPEQKILPFCLYQHNTGGEWSHRYDEIAQCKALQLWHDRNNDGGTDITAHLLFPGDTQWWGGVKREGIVVACSGFQTHFDRMIAGMVADMCIALARDAFINDHDRITGADFLK